MRILSTIDEFVNWRNHISGFIGFVPTMGALHKGHFSLVEESNRLCEYTVVSIYLNPKQFAPQEDLDEYPQNTDKDINNLRSYNVDAVFIPADAEIYQDGFSSSINITALTSVLEGKSRPHFFQGVTTVVAKLFNIVNPTHAFFGQKDAQQLRVIKKMVKDLNYSIDIISCPTIREKNGLAMSSRNRYLPPDDFEDASIIFKGLNMAKSLLNSGEKNADVIRNQIKDYISTKKSLTIDYISVSNNLTLKEIHSEIKSDILVSIAVYFGKVRLIDNFSYFI